MSRLTTEVHALAPEGKACARARRTARRGRRRRHRRCRRGQRAVRARRAGHAARARALRSAAARAVSRRAADGRHVQMERGFHALLSPVLQPARAAAPHRSRARHAAAAAPTTRSSGPAGMLQTFRDLPKRTPFQVMALTARTPYLRARDLLHVDGRAALEMLRFDARAHLPRFDARPRPNTSIRCASRHRPGACCSMSSHTRFSTPRRTCRRPSC